VAHLEPPFLLPRFSFCFFSSSQAAILCAWCDSFLVMASTRSYFSFPTSMSEAKTRRPGLPPPWSKYRVWGKFQNSTFTPPQLCPDFPFLALPGAQIFTVSPQTRGRVRGKPRASTWGLSECYFSGKTISCVLKWFPGAPI
jgi:hypothetical protein